MIYQQVYHYVYDRHFIYQLTSTVITYYTIKILNFFYRRNERYKIFKEYGIPGPKQSLLGGNLDDYLAAGDNFKYDEYLKGKYGKLFGVFIGDQPCLITCDLDLLKKVFLEEQSSFTERAETPINSPLTASILFAKYPRWKKMRRAMVPHFTASTVKSEPSFKLVENSIHLMNEYIDFKIESCQRSGTSSIFDIQSLMKSTTLHLISKMAVKLEDARVEENNNYVNSLDQFMDESYKGVVTWAIRFPFVRSIVEFLADHVEHNRFLSVIKRNIERIIVKNAPEESSQRYSDDDAPQIIDELAKLHHQGKMTKDEVLGNAEALLIAGYDTTSTTLTYLMWILSKRTDIQETLRQELMAHGIDSLYLTQIINETMRLYPTVTTFTTRVANKTVMIDDNLIIPKGTEVKYHAWLIYRDPEIWPNPLEFDPDRFKEGNQIHPCAFAPFGLGERKCLGSQLALLELKMIVCNIILRYKLRLKDTQELELAEHAGVLTKPKNKIMLEIYR